jgi:16S rRNA (uracil1498-N3)-methyltransferase
MNVFYKPNIVSDHLILDQKESTHCIKVMRYRKGDQIRLIDGVGGFYLSEIDNEDPRACGVRIISKVEKYKCLPYELNIAIAPTKSVDRYEWFVEKATEIGISSIIPLFCARSERKNIRLDRIRKVAVSAMKQSVKAYLPVINEPVDFNKWIELQHPGTNFIAHCMEPPGKDIRTVELSEQITILIGPEGDFSPDEVSKAITKKFTPLSLGNYRLRTETAGIVACSAIHFRAGN